jgi:hypothetical protein
MEYPARFSFLSEATENLYVPMKTTNLVKGEIIEKIIL